MAERLQIEQALFGYRDGHHLLTASVELAPRVRQFLANVTDGSGPDTPDGFEIGYTGLAVPETEYYALFCTWPAPEMPRPGCVWSHVLLIDFASLAKVADLSMIRELCFRPAKPQRLADYERSLYLPASEAPSLENAETLVRAEYLVWTLYGKPESGIVVLDEESLPWEPAVFGVWSQQWPRLRRNFAFSTCSLGDRRLGGVAFDLQIAPMSSHRLWQRGGPLTLVQEFPTRDALVPTPRWVQTALSDLRSGAKEGLRDFFFAYGSDVELPRQAFAHLVECFMGPPKVDEDDPSQRFVQLATAFPQPTEAVRLKRDQLASAISGVDSGDVDATWAAVYFLLRGDGAPAFSRVPFEFGPLVGMLWQRKRADVIDLLGRLPEGERSTDFIRALASVVSSEEIPAIWSERPDAVPQLIRLRPSLASNDKAWSMPEKGQRTLWKSAHSATTEQATWADICAAMLSAHSAFAERETVALAGTSLSSGLLKWLRAVDLTLPSRAWRDALRIPLTKALHGEELPPSLLALAVWTLPAPDARSLSGHRLDVQTLARQIPACLPKPLILHTLFWLVALGLQTPGQDGLALMSCAFFSVYDAVARSDYPGEAWQILEPLLPELFFGMDWDRCRRLRRALRLWIRDNDALGQPLQQAAPTIEHARLVDRLRY